jgi:hypothetical protein
MYLSLDYAGGVLKGALPMYASSVLCFLVFTCRLCIFPHTRGPVPVIYPLSIKSIHSRTNQLEPPVANEATSASAQLASPFGSFRTCMGKGAGQDIVKRALCGPPC